MTLFQLLVQSCQVRNSGGRLVAASFRPCCTSLSNRLSPSKCTAFNVFGASSYQQNRSVRCVLTSKEPSAAGEMEAITPGSCAFHRLQAPGPSACAEDTLRGSRVDASSFRSSVGPCRVHRVHLQAWQGADSDYNAAGDHNNVASRGAGLKGQSRPISLKELKRQKEAHRTASDGGQAKGPLNARNLVALQQSLREEPGSDDYSSELSEVEQTESEKHRPVARGQSWNVLPVSPRPDKMEKPSNVQRSSRAQRTAQALNTSDIRVDKLYSKDATQQTSPSFLSVEDFLKREAAKKRHEGIRDEDNPALSALEGLGKEQMFEVQKTRTRVQRYRQGSILPPWIAKYDEAAADESGEPDTTEVEEAKEKAILLLNRRHKSASELRNKLTQSGFAANAVKAAVDRVQEVGLQNDLEYAEAFARVRWQGFKWGPERVKRELKMKGVGASDVEKAIAAVYGERAANLRVSTDEEAEGDYNLEDDVSGCIERELYVAAKRHFLSGTGQDVNKRWKKTADWLARRGYNWATASSIMTALKAEPDVWI